MQYVEYEKIKEKFEYLYNLYPTGIALSKDLGTSKTLPIRLYNKKSRVMARTYHQINELYDKCIKNNVTTEELENREISLKEKRGAVWKKKSELEEILKENEKYIKTLIVGNTYTIELFNESEDVFFSMITGKVIAEYPNLFMIETPNYNECILKNDLRLRKTKVKGVKNGKSKKKNKRSWRKD